VVTRVDFERQPFVADVSHLLGSDGRAKSIAMAEFGRINETCLAEFDQWSLCRLSGRIAVAKPPSPDARKVTCRADLDHNRVSKLSLWL
jgi:hypothetical protein